MTPITVYTFHRGINPARFDSHNTQQLLDYLRKSYIVEWKDLNGEDRFVYQGVPITHGSITIIEFKDSGKFRVYDFGDSPDLTAKLSQSALFDGAAIGQYNKTLWDELVKDVELRSKVKPGPYPETYWGLGVQNYNAFQEYRKATPLSRKLHWRGSLYANGVSDKYLGVRKALELLPQEMSSDEFNFQGYPVQFDQYIQEAANHQLVLSIGGGGGYTCGDFCFRDIEMYGLGIPTLRPVYAIEPTEPLIPNYHYISVEAEFDSQFKYKNPEQLAKAIAKRYREVIDDTDYLLEVGDSARSWYIRNIASPNILNILTAALNL